MGYNHIESLTIGRIQIAYVVRPLHPDAPAALPGRFDKGTGLPDHLTQARREIPGGRRSLACACQDGSATVQNQGDTGRVGILQAEMVLGETVASLLKTDFDPLLPGFEFPTDPFRHRIEIRLRTYPDRPCQKRNGPKGGSQYTEISIDSHIERSVCLKWE